MKLSQNMKNLPQSACLAVEGIAAVARDSIRSRPEFRALSLGFLRNFLGSIPDVV